jgi:hypothetical protein
MAVFWDVAPWRQPSSYSLPWELQISPVFIVFFLLFCGHFFPAYDTLHDNVFHLQRDTVDFKQFKNKIKTNSQIYQFEKSRFFKHMWTFNGTTSSPKDSLHFCFLNVLLIITVYFEQHTEIMQLLYSCCLLMWPRFVHHTETIYIFSVWIVLSGPLPTVKSGPKMGIEMEIKRFKTSAKVILRIC